MSERHLLPEAIAFKRASFVINLRAKNSKSFPKFWARTYIDIPAALFEVDLKSWTWAPKQAPNLFTY